MPQGPVDMEETLDKEEACELEQQEIVVEPAVKTKITPTKNALVFTGHNSTHALDQTRRGTS
eukprot:8096511-Lingulodinium_polyedra.AAC.1